MCAREDLKVLSYLLTEIFSIKQKDNSCKAKKVITCMREWPWQCLMLDHIILDTTFKTLTKVGNQKLLWMLKFRSLP